MDLNMIERHWDGLLGTMLKLFPELERSQLESFEGRISGLVEYIARSHDLTREEAILTLEERVLLPASLDDRAEHPRMAAE